MKQLKFALALFIGLGLAFCDDATSNSGGSGDEIDLESELTTVGNLVTIPSNGSEAINGKVVDEDNSGTADGLDLSGDGNANFTYVGTLSVKGTARNGDSIGFYIGDNESEVFYFVADGEDLGISVDEGGNAGVQLIVNNDGTLAGLDTTGNGTADAGQDELGGIEPAFVGELTDDSCFVGTWSGSSENPVELVIRANGDAEAFIDDNGDGEFLYYSGEWLSTGYEFGIFILNVGFSTDSLADAEANVMPVTSGADVESRI